MSRGGASRLLSQFSSERGDAWPRSLRAPPHSNQNLSSLFGPRLRPLGVQAPPSGPLHGNVAAALERWRSEDRSLDRCPSSPCGCTREFGSVWTAGRTAEYREGEGGREAGWSDRPRGSSLGIGRSCLRPLMAEKQARDTLTRKDLQWLL